jgi:peptidoglycan/LPS O-acetylase OafA/YrhL
MRLFGAFLVLIGHAYPLHGRTDYPHMWGSPVAVLGVVLFFSLSGYLITTSWRSDPNLPRYLRKRALRIFPALAAVVVLCAFVLGPIVSSLSVRDYFSGAGPWTYLANIALFPSYTLPGVFQTVPYEGVVNGSLWSLPIEFACYLFVPLVVLAPVHARAWAFAVLAVVFGVTSQLLIANDVVAVFYGSSLAQATSVWPYFMVGAAISCVKSPTFVRLDVAVVGLLAASLVDSVRPEMADFIWWFALPYAVIAIGSAATPVVSRIGRFGDLSYGVYLYAFPIQQLMMLSVPQIPFFMSISATAILSSLAAFASWHLIEKHALKWKNGRRPSRTSSPGRPLSTADAESRSDIPGRRGMRKSDRSDPEKKASKNDS